MTSWIYLVPTMLIAACVLLVPGLLVGIAFRLRGLWLWAAAGPLSVSVIAVSSVVLSFMSIPWGILGVLAVAVALAVLVWVLVRLWWKQPRMSAEADSQTPGLWWIVPLALGGGAVLLVWRTSQAIGAPENISQTFDNIFHLNAVRFILDTGDASPLRIGLMNSPQGNLGFYPSGWHALVSLVAGLSGASIPAATNATIFAVAALVWVSGAVLLSRVLLGARPAVTLIAAVLSAAFAGFPLLLVYYGVLYPLFLGLAVVPVALAVVLTVTGISRSETGMTLPTGWLMLLGLVPGVALSHPGALMALLALCVPVVTVWAWCAFNRGEHRVRTVILFGAFLVGGVVALVLVRPPREQATWPPVLSAPQAFLHFVTAELTRSPIPWVLAALVIVGVLVAALRRTKQDIALLGMYVMAAVLFVIVAGVGYWRIRFWTTGIWYQNIPRIEAITVLVMLPLAVLGATWVFDAVVRVLSPKKNGAAEGSRLTFAKVGSALVVAVLLACAVGNPQMKALVQHSAASYEFRGDSALVSTDELALFGRLAETVPSDATIVTNGWTGAGLAYAFAGRWVTMPHVMVDFTEDTIVLNEQLNAAVAGGPVCNAARAERAQFVLDFGAREVHGGKHDFPGLVGLENSPAVELVDQEGEAKLYRIVACDENVAARG